MSEPRCYVCGQSERDSPEVELRPYGKGGQPICFDCMNGDPERKAEAMRQFSDACDRVGPGVIVIGDSAGPRAGTYEETVFVADVLPGFPRPGKS